MIRYPDLARVQDQFGVAETQVLRDHLISHVLAALSAMPGSGELVFLGGTALSRTLLPDLRLSEDIDLVSTCHRGVMAGRIMGAVDAGLARTHGTLEWLPAMDRTRNAEPSVIRADGGLTVQIQMLSQTGHPPWPTMESDLEQRYADAPSARMRVLTPAAFVAAKLAAWHDRQAPRDLYDLWALAQAGHVDHEAIDLYVRLGPTGRPPAEREFGETPSSARWSAALDHQGRTRVDARAACETVHSVITELVRGRPPP